MIFIKYRFLDDSVSSDLSFDEIKLLIDKKCKDNNHILTNIVFSGVDLLSPFSCNKFSTIQKLSTLHVLSVDNFTTDQLIHYVISEDRFKNIKSIGKLKPVATEYSGSNCFNLNYFDNLNIDKSSTLSKLSNYVSELNNYDVIIDIFRKQNGCQVVFYSVKDLLELCDIFGYSLEHSLDFLTTPQTMGSRELEFIHIAFGDYVGLSPVQIDIKTCSSYNQQKFEQFKNR